MTLKKNNNFLVSLKNLDEISKEVIKEVDILDLKNPIKGAIGSWNIIHIKKVINLYKNKILISATLGNVFKNKDFLIKLSQFDSLNLDFIKFGLLTKNQENLFEKVSLLTLKVYKTTLVCVVFVDVHKNLQKVGENLEYLQQCGLRNILLDTYEKRNGNLLNFFNVDYLKKFILKCKNYKIRVGLAGGLKEPQLSMIIDLNPYLIGFRSAICKSENRKSSIDIEKVKVISGYFNSFNNKAIESAGA